MVDFLILILIVLRMAQIVIQVKIVEKLVMKIDHRIMIGCLLDIVSRRIMIVAWFENYMLIKIVLVYPW